jgi:hypothetical protein
LFEDAYPAQTAVPNPQGIGHRAKAHDSSKLTRTFARAAEASDFAAIGIEYTNVEVLRLTDDEDSVMCGSDIGWQKRNKILQVAVNSSVRLWSDEHRLARALNDP